MAAAAGIRDGDGGAYGTGGIGQHGFQGSSTIPKYRILGIRDKSGAADRDGITHIAAIGADGQPGRNRECCNLI